MSDYTFSHNIVLGSLSVSLESRPDAISPRLPFSETAAILENGEPNPLVGAALGIRPDGDAARPRRRPRRDPRLGGGRRHGVGAACHRPGRGGQDAARGGGGADPAATRLERRLPAARREAWAGRRRLGPQGRRALAGDRLPRGAAGGGRGAYRAHRGHREPAAADPLPLAVAARLADPRPGLPDWIYAATAGTGRELGSLLSRLAWDLTELSADGRGAAPLERAVLAMIAAPGRAAEFIAVGFEQGTAFSAAFAARVLGEALEGGDDPEVRAPLLNNLANVLSDLGRREEALASATEAVELCRRLAAAHPEAFTPKLATSLNNLASLLSGLGRREDALAAATEAVELLAPFFQALPLAYADWMRTMAGVYLRACEAGDQEPSDKLLMPIVAAFEPLDAEST